MRSLQVKFSALVVAILVIACVALAWVATQHERRALEAAVERHGRALAENLATGTGGLVYTGSFHQLGVQALGLLAVGAFTFSPSFSALWAMKAAFGIRAELEVETAGLDVSEHGM